jgi:hypothetical protein
MNRNALRLSLTAVLLIASGTALACDYKAGETKFLDYANCRYGEDRIVVVNLNNSPAWDSCIYQAEAFMPPKLLAVTKDENGKEILSLNNRSKIGNPCYLTKSRCDKALKAQLAGGN